MQLKLILILILSSSISACSSSSISSQVSIDTRACSAISYGNKNIDVQSIDDIYVKCMDDKSSIRKQQKTSAKNRAIFEFFIDLFWPTTKHD